MNNNPYKGHLVSIIIINYNDTQHTIECLDSIKNTNYDNYEIILVDNGSENDLVEILRQRNDIKLVELNKNYGFVQASNIGIEKSKGELICLLNNDTIVDADWLSKLIDTLASNKTIGAVYPFFIDYGISKTRWWPTSDLLKALKNGSYNLIGYPIDSVFDDYVTTFLNGSACCILFKKAIAGTYSDNDYFMYYDDVYFCWKLLLQGCLIKRSPYAVIYHKGFNPGCNKTFAEKRAYLCERNRIMTLLIFYKLKTLLKIMPLLLIDEIKKITLMLFRLFYNPAYILCIISARLWILKNMASIYKKRRLIQAHRIVKGDEDIIKGLSCNFLNSRSLWAVFLNRLFFYYAQFINLRTYEIIKEQDAKHANGVKATL